jgi:hypothetical protein
MTVITVSLAGFPAAVAVRAQAPAAGATLDAAAISESLAVLAQLDRTVRAHPRLGCVVQAWNDRMGPLWDARARATVRQISTRRGSVALQTRRCA